MRSNSLKVRLNNLRGAQTHVLESALVTVYATSRHEYFAKYKTQQPVGVLAPHASKPSLRTHLHTLKHREQEARVRATSTTDKISHHCARNY